MPLPSGEARQSRRWSRGASGRRDSDRRPSGCGSVWQTRRCGWRLAGADRSGQLFPLLAKIPGTADLFPAGCQHSTVEYLGEQAGAGGRSSKAGAEPTVNRYTDGGQFEWHTDMRQLTLICLLDDQAIAAWLRPPSPGCRALRAGGPASILRMQTASRIGPALLLCTPWPAQGCSSTGICTTLLVQ